MDDSATKQAISLLLPHAEAALSSQSGPPVWPDAVYDGKRAHLQTAQDKTIPLVAQNAMVTYSGVQWDIKRIKNAGHSRFLSHTKEVADWVVTKAKAYVA